MGRPRLMSLPGGKYNLAPRILSQLRHQSGERIATLIDPFIGGGHVPLYGLQQGVVGRVRLNDADRHTAAFWTQIIQNPFPLVDRWLSPLPEDDEIEEHLMAMYPRPYREPATVPWMTLEERAWWRFVFRWRCWSGNPGSHFRKEVRRPGEKRWPNRAWAAVHMLNAHKLLRGRVVRNECTCKDFGPIMLEPGLDDASLFLDPPYRGTEDCYRHPFGIPDHLRLHRLLVQERRHWLLTYGEHLLIRALYGDWCDIERVIVPATMQTIAPVNKPVRPLRADLVITPSARCLAHALKHLKTNRN